MKILTVDIAEKQKSEILHQFNLIKSGYICVTSVHGLIEAYENEYINEAFANSFANVPDGMPIVYYSRWFKKINLSRITGPELIYDFLTMLDETSSSIATVGSNKDTIDKFSEILKKDYGNIELLNSNFSFIDINSKTSLESILEFCVKNKADYYLVFLSTPKQDVLMNYLNKEINSKFIGFGAAVDYFVGNTKYAPKFMQTLSLEWLFRLFQEPKRLFKRYLQIIPKFFFYLAVSFFSKNKQ